MIWITLIASLIPLIIELIQWLSKKKKAGEALNGKERVKLNALLAKTRELDTLATSMGCDSE